MRVMRESVCEREIERWGNTGSEEFKVGSV